MIKGIDVNQRIEFSLTSDKDEPKTVFVMKPLSGLEMMEFSTGAKADIINMISKSIVEVKNFLNANASVSEILNCLNIQDIGELINKVNEINMITRQDSKN